MKREFLAKELVLMKQMMLWKPELLILMVAMMKMKQNNVEKRHQTKAWNMSKKSCGTFTTPELEGLQIRRISAKKWLFLLVLQAGTRRSHEFGYHDMGILKGNKCSRGECSEYKTHEGAQWREKPRETSFANTADCHLDEG